jgi:hypothetical protein
LVYLIVLALLVWALLGPRDVAAGGKGPVPRKTRCDAAVQAYLVSAVQYGEPMAFQGAYRQLMYSACGGGR